MCFAGMIKQVRLKDFRLCTYPRTNAHIAHMYACTQAAEQKRAKMLQEVPVFTHMDAVNALMDNPHPLVSEHVLFVCIEHSSARVDPHTHAHTHIP